MSPITVALWRNRYLRQRLPGIERDAPRPGRPPVLPASRIQRVIQITLSRPPAGARYWSARRVAEAVGTSKTTVQRVWKAYRLRSERPSGSRDGGPSYAFASKVTDLVGVYLHPPERAMVFSVDQRAKTSGLGREERQAIAQLEDRSRATEFRAFLQAIDRETPKQLDLHLLLDNRLAPASPEIREWLVRHPRFYLHFLPSDGSGPNLIERWFSEFTNKRVRRGTFPSVRRLHRGIREHFTRPGTSVSPFVWTATAEEIRDRFGRTRIR